MEAYIDINKEAKLCRNCNKFYGQDFTNYLCSKCLKGESAPNENINQNIQTDHKQKNDDVIVNKSNCKMCHKKIGLLGYECKCTFYFCKNHRLPENHECNFDFINDGKKRLIANNPVITSKKISEI